MNTREIKSKRPWKRILPDGKFHGIAANSAEERMPEDDMIYEIVTQADFMRQYYPSGHEINDPLVYPDIFREEEVPVLDSEGNDTGKKTVRLYKEIVPRYAFAFQQIIVVKHLVHLCGNDIQFELDGTDRGDSEQADFNLFREGWLKKDMEIRFYESAKSVKITGDTAFVGYMNRGKFGGKVLSFMDGDTLYPHYDSLTGELRLFARSFSDYDENGREMTEWLEVWDEKYLTRLRRSSESGRSMKDRILGIFGVEGYRQVEKRPHGFPFIPVSYRRDPDGPCWHPSQGSIEGYEMSFSQMAHNNQTFGEPVLIFQGEGANLDMQYDFNGTVKTMSMGPDDKASYLNSQSASESYMKQLDNLYKMIFSQSFIVEPPELKSGDLPAAALKILYSPAVEKAMTDATEYRTFLDGMVRIFSYGYGLEKQKTIDFANLDMKWWIEPYVHVNSTTVVNDLAIAVQNGFCSRRTAAERIETLYTTNGEWDRIMREEKEKRKAELLFQLQTAKAARRENEKAEVVDGVKE